MKTKFRSFWWLSFAFSLGLSLHEVSAAPVNAEQAKATVKGWPKADRDPLETAVGQLVKRVETFDDGKGTVLYHIVYLAPAGFVIVAADDLVEPIIGFAPAGQFDPSGKNPLGALVSNDLPGRITKAKTIGTGKATGMALAAKNKWEKLSKQEKTPGEVEQGIVSVSEVRVAPLTATMWDQTTAAGSACYNYYTPPNAAGNQANYPCGCVATAMAQLMKLWKHPVNGVGTTSFSITVDGGAQSRPLLGGDGLGGAYVWDDMVTTPNAIEHYKAIGALCADAGVAAESAYSTGLTGSTLLKAGMALRNTFGYSSAIFGWNGNNEIGAGLTNMINPGLDAGSVALLAITRTSGGHAVVCDGYGYDVSTLYHHLNLGWSGTATAWYNLPNIDTNTANGTYNVVEQCLYNVWPSGTGEIISGRLTDSGGTPIPGALVTATRSGGASYTATSNARGIYALAKIPSSTTYTLSASKVGYAFASKVATTGRSSDYVSSSGNKWGVDFTPLPMVTLGTDASQIVEAGGAATLTATLSAVSGVAVTVNVTFSGTATYPGDYTRSGTTITIPAGSLSGSLNVSAVNDSEPECLETVVVTLASGTGYAVGTPSAAMVNILENDLPLGVVYVRSGAVGTPTGTMCAPFPTVKPGYQAAQSGNILRISAGEYREKDLRMDKTLLLEATNGTVNIGKP